MALSVVISSPSQATRWAKSATTTVVEPTEAVAIVAMLAWKSPCPMIHLPWVRLAAHRVWVNRPQLQVDGDTSLLRPVPLAGAGEPLGPDYFIQVLHVLAPLLAPSKH